MRLKSPGDYLDVGCGPNTHANVINLDYEWRPGIDICCNITRGLPIPDNYVGGIFSEHCLEHIPLEDAVFVTKEFQRVLMPGRYIRIIVPDFAIYVNAWANGKPMPYADEDTELGIYSSMMSINRILRAHGHQFMYDLATLTLLLANAGFTGVQQKSFGVSSDPKLLLDTPSRAVKCLYVEAQKPLQAALTHHP